MSQTIAETIAAECLVMRVRRLNREVSRLYDARARRHDLSAGSSNLLVAIATHPGVRASELVEPLSMDKSTLSRSIARLEAAGLVRSEVAGRGRRLYVTGAGEAKIEAIYEDWQEVQSEVRALLGELVGPLMER